MFIGRDGYGKLVQRALETQRHLVDSNSKSVPGTKSFHIDIWFPDNILHILASFMENSMFFAHVVIAFQSYCYHVLNNLTFRLRTPLKQFNDPK